MTVWSPQQDRVLIDGKRWFLDKKDSLIYRLWGRAGTGKTTIAKEFVDYFESLGFNTICCAYTGKAASVLRSKGLPKSVTFHSKLYIPAMVSRKRLTEALAELEKIGAQLSTPGLDTATRRALLDRSIELKDKVAFEEQAQKSPQFLLNSESELLDVDLIIADEVSMLDERLGADLVETCKRGGARLLLMGDPNQLPPVRGNAYFMGEKPDFHLTDIMRQAKDDPILYLADRILDGKTLEVGSYGDSKVVSALDQDEALACDQALCGTNSTRLYYTKRMRELRGYEAIVEPGEKLMCLANSKEGYFNGQIWYVDNVDIGEEFCHASLISDDPLEPDRHAVIHNDSLAGKEVHWMDRQGAQCMFSAQMVTVHKFQGSQANHVVVLDESFTARNDRIKWLYTATTRAAKKVTIRL